MKLTGSLPDWVSAKDVILTLLGRHGVEGGFGRIIEYYGPGLEGLTAMDRHVIANMGAEMGATTSVFPPMRRRRPSSTVSGAAATGRRSRPTRAALTTTTRRSISPPSYR